MHKDFKKSSTGAVREQSLLSPKQALEKLEAGVPPHIVLAWLDVDQCHFAPRG